MSRHDLFQIFFYLAALVSLAVPLGAYLAAALEDKGRIQSSLFGPAERFIYRACGINPAVQMNWKSYTASLLWFNLFGFLAVFLLQLFQHKLPLNPNHNDPVGTVLAFNTAVSFMTNTNWQAYAGETTLSYLTQMAGLTVQNFLSAATGIAVFAAMARGFMARKNAALGNFWGDIVRVTMRILLPLSLFIALLLAGQGVVQTFKPNTRLKTLEGAGQTIPLGPAASQIAIKQAGTNGGGFFNANSAHPLENPTPLSNFIEMLSLLLLPAACVFAYGKLTADKGQARILFGVN